MSNLPEYFILPDLIATLPSPEYAVLYRFAVALAGLNSETEQLVHDVIEENFGRLLPPETLEASRENLLELLHEVWEEFSKNEKSGPVSNLPPVFHWMTAEQRAAACIHGLGDFTVEEIQRICGVAEADENPALPQEKIAAALQAVPVSPEMYRRFSATARTANAPFSLLSPLGLSLIFAALVLLAVSGWVWHDWYYHEDDAIAAKFILSAEKTNRARLESVDLSVGELSDILFLKHGLENYPLPPEFLKYRVALLGVDLLEGHQIVQIALKDSPVLLILFRANDFGIDGDHPAWRTATKDGWAMGLRTRAGQGHVVTLPGNEKNLRPFLVE